jgi:FtsZ-interacting cell division protein ZipA
MMKPDTNPVKSEAQRLVDKIKASKAAARAKRLARLADPNTPPSQRKKDEWWEQYETQQQDANERYEAQEREVQQRKVEELYEALQREAQRREAPEWQAQLPKPKRKSGRKSVNDNDQRERGIKILVANRKLKGKRALEALRKAGIEGGRTTMYEIIKAAKKVRK